MNAENTRQFAYVIRPSRATFPSDASDDERRIVGEHFQYLKRLCDAGTVVLAGRCEDATFGIIVFTAPDDAAARALMNDDPAVRAGIFTAELHPFRIALLRESESERST
jgi:uncharacterized protein YciI